MDEKNFTGYVIAASQRGIITRLEEYIAAGEMRVKEEEQAIETDRKSIDITDSSAVQKLALKETELEGFKKKIQELRVQKIKAEALLATAESLCM